MAEANSAVSVGNTNGMISPTVIEAMPKSIGLRVPSRSATRPA